MSLVGKKIALGVSGGIAAFKAVTLTRLLLKEGAAVQVLMTCHAKHFVGPVTFSALTKNRVVDDIWSPEISGEIHVDVAAWADLMVIAPATMNLISKMAAGIADNAVLATGACMNKPIFLAPAMHTNMWNNAALQRNLERLVKDGVKILGPVDGPLASGESGMGRMMEPEDILKFIFDEQRI